MLPSGRKLFYSNPHFKDKKIGRSTMPMRVLCYDGIIQETKQWGEIDTYGGKLTENIVQAIARDLIGYSMMQLDRAGYRIVAHIHDECISEVPFDGKEQQYYDMMVALMSTPPDWASDLPLRADGYLTPYYKKD
jgi:DNA polymerase